MSRSNEAGDVAMIAGAVRTLRIASHTLALRMCQECRAVVSALCDGTNPLLSDTFTVPEAALGTMQSK